MAETFAGSLAIVATHPIQYHAPWFRHIASRCARLRVFYLWDFGVTPRVDRGFGHEIVWDIPLLDGYAHEFVPNLARDPGTHHFFGLWNPGLIARLDADRPDAVLLMGYPYATFLRLLLAPTLWRVPFLLRGDSHRLVAPPAGPGPRLRAILQRALFLRFAAFLCVGAANRDYYRQRGVSPRRLFFAPAAIDNARFGGNAAALARRSAARRELGLDERACLILFAGKLEQKKRPDLLIEAFRRLRHPQARLLMVGDGPLAARVRELAAADARISFLPFQNQSRMPELYALADLFVLPSEGPHETWGLAVNEAMAAQRAVAVSTHVGCAADLVKPGINGWVFAAGDAGALEAVLREAVADPQRLQRMGRQSAGIVASYSYEAATAGLVGALRAVVGR